MSLYTLSFLPVVEIITDPAHPDIEKIHALGETFFPDEDVFETEGRFRECLANNQNPALQNAYGPAQEIWMVLKNEREEIIAAHNMMMIATPNGAVEGCDGFAWWIYTFVAHAYRKMGIGTYLKPLVQECITDYLTRTNQRPCTNFLVLCEQSDPLRMTPAEIKEDISASGIDPFDRILMTQSYFGFRRYSGYYMQPALSGHETGCNHLTLQIWPYNLLNVTKTHLKKALSPFFAISVLGGDPMDNAITKEVIERTDEDFSLENDQKILYDTKKRAHDLIAVLDQQGVLYSTEKNIKILLEEQELLLPALE